MTFKLPFRSEQEFPIEFLRRPLRSTDDTKVCNNNWSKKKTWDFAIVYNPVYLAEQQHFRFYKCFLSQSFCDFLVPCRTFKLDNAWYPHVAHLEGFAHYLKIPGKVPFWKKMLKQKLRRLNLIKRGENAFSLVLLGHFLFNWNETLWTNFKHSVMQSKKSYSILESGGIKKVYEKVAKTVISKGVFGCQQLFAREK